jgi:hypothetical protein
MYAERSAKRSMRNYSSKYIYLYFIFKYFSTYKVYDANALLAALVHCTAQRHFRSRLYELYKSRSDAYRLLLELGKREEVGKGKLRQVGGYSNILKPLLQGHLEIAAAPIFCQVHYKIIVATILCQFHQNRSRDHHLLGSS